MTPGEASQAASAVQPSTVTPPKSEVKSGGSKNNAESTTETGETPKAGE